MLVQVHEAEGTTSEFFIVKVLLVVVLDEIGTVVFWPVLRVHFNSIIIITLYFQI